MALSFVGLEWDALDPQRQAEFWAGVLGGTVSTDQVTGNPVLSRLHTAYAISFATTTIAKVGDDRIHFDLTSRDHRDQNAIVQRVLDLGGTHLDIGQTPDDGHVVLADPEGNALCVIEPESQFLAGTDVIGAINCDGTAAPGRFWAEALDWPLVWDEGEETAIQSPSGGSKITWSGPPLLPRHGRDRMRFQVAASGDRDAEVERLIALGASADSDRPPARGPITLRDPDGNEFALLPRDVRPAAGS